MDIVYIPQLEDIRIVGESTVTRYRLLTKTPEAGAVGLTDKAVNKIVAETSDPLRLVVPPLVTGQVRDFFVRLVVLADTPPELVLAAPAGETISLEDAGASALTCGVGINIFSFTETDAGVFFASHRRTDVEVTVTFDVQGGTPEFPPAVYKLGARFQNLPTPTKSGYAFSGWLSAPGGGGVLVRDGDTVKSSLTTLYASWMPSTQGGN